MRSIELFAGAGGLAIGMANAGFQHAAVVEWNHDACETFRENQRHHTHAVEGWPVHEVDARVFDFSAFGNSINVISGGPPCQPFSQGGKHKAQHDERNMFPEAIRAVREIMPDAFIFENVKGLTRQSFSEYFTYIYLQLQHPEFAPQKNEDWASHKERLEKYHSANKGASTYNVFFDVLNAADFGVPQKRQRVFFVGFRSDLGAQWAFPKPTHSENSLIISKWINKSYWDEHEISKKIIPTPPQQLAKKIELLKKEYSTNNLARWNTTRDALKNLPDPETQKKSSIPNHIFTPGARSYIGHTGSLLDEPAKTLKAGHHGVPGGENMFIKDDGSIRYFTVREAARLQTFPDEYEFCGAWSQTMRQLGNAVPVLLAEVIAKSVARSLYNIRTAQS
ncbi:DNA cytosine methyltransferase [Pseudomonas sp. NPDC089406]|uniref:DNA cytosine methyltransferase n=1 Tax=Pseudomonas sp. NPDC089406 TaxID=3364463 RepID=UPI003850B832